MLSVKKEDGFAVCRVNRRAFSCLLSTLKLPQVRIEQELDIESSLAEGSVKEAVQKWPT